MREQLRHVERADLADARDVVAQEIDDHAVLRLVLRIVAQEMLQSRRPRPWWRRAARCPSSDAISIQPSASISKNSSGERDRTTGSPSETSAPYFTGWRSVSAAKADERIARPSRLDREGEVRLVAVALAQMPVHALEALFVVGERPCRRGRRRSARWSAARSCAAAAVSDGPSNTPKQHERRPPPFGQQRRSASPRTDSRPHRRNSRPAICLRCVRLRACSQRCKEIGRVVRHDDAPTARSNSKSLPARSSRKSTKGDVLAIEMQILADCAVAPCNAALRQLLAYSSASSSSISPPITPRPICQNAGSEASRPNGFSSSE